MTNTRLYAMITDTDKSAITKSMRKQATKRRAAQSAGSFKNSIDFYKNQLKHRTPPRG